MGSLMHSDGRVEELNPLHLVGRSRRANLQLDRPWVSSQHAALRWLGHGWEIKDLGSRNGTYVDGTRLEPGETRPLTEGSVMAFGHPDEAWVLLSDAPATCSAVGPDRELRGEASMLALPSPEEPLATVYRKDVVWMLETATEQRRVEDGETIEVNGESWELRLPVAVDATVEQAGRLGLSELSLHFAVSADEEYVQLEALGAGHRLDLGARVHNYLLLTLARIHLEEAEHPEEQRGWVDIRQLERMLGMTELQLNLQVFRARKQLGAAGVEDSAGLVERRVGSGQLRLAPLPVQVSRA